MAFQNRKGVLSTTGVLTAAAFLLISLLPIPASATTGTLTITEDTVLTENHFGDIVVAADIVTLDCAGFSVTGSGSGAGIRVEARTGVTVTYCIVTNFIIGFRLDGSSSNTLTQNTVINNNSAGFALNASNENTLTENTATNNGVGFSLRSSSNQNTLTENAATNNGVGFELVFSNQNTLTQNAATGSTGSFGFSLSRSRSNTLTQNTATNNNAGFRLNFSSRNTLTQNTALNNKSAGFALNASKENTLTENTAINNNFGFDLDSFQPQQIPPNLIAHNNIIGNTVQATDTDPAANDWHHPGLLEGNFWSDYIGVDDGSGTGKHGIAGDGIGDTLVPHPGPDFDNFPRRGIQPGAGHQRGRAGRRRKPHSLPRESRA